MTPPLALATDWSDDRSCRNCGAALATPFCGACGQKRVTRLGTRAIGLEAWQGLRLFELSIVRAAARLVREPGTVAREYVLGRRTAHVHPLKLLAIAIGLLLVVLSQSAYLDSNDAHVTRAMALVRTYSNGSFSLGIVAVFAASWLVFRRRLAYNATEHLVLAVHVQVLVIAASIANKLPTLVWRSPEFLAAHKAASAIYMDVAGVVIVAFAFRQFFLLAGTRDAWRLAFAAAVFLAIKTALLRLYATALVKLVLASAA